MLSRLALASGTALALTFGGGLAQTDEATEAQPPADDQLIVEQSEDQTLSAELLGADVLHPEEGVIGTLESLLFDEDDRIVGGVVSVGGFLGMGAKEVALSWNEFDVRPEERLVEVDLTREQLEAAPSFKDRDTLLAEQQAEEAQRQIEMQQTQQGY